METKSSHSLHVAFSPVGVPALALLALLLAVFLSALYSQLALADDESSFPDPFSVYTVPVQSGQPLPSGIHGEQAPAPSIEMQDNPAGRVRLAASGGPDAFGYRWDDSVPLQWIDATSGTDTGMSGDATRAVGPIALPFAFPYYENSYSTIYIAGAGYVAFTQYRSWGSTGSIPSASTPNNLIAPFSTNFHLDTVGPANRVYYKSGGVSPDRYFAVEWYQVKNTESSSTSDTFQVILYENGNIKFQYQTMPWSPFYASAGIEDSTGNDGLSYIPFSYGNEISNKGVLFSRPAPGARLRIAPLYQGDFGSAGEPADFRVTILNLGDLGSDAYDLASSAWPVSLYAADGITPLADSDGNGKPDTGLIPARTSATITVKVTTPATATVGSNNSAAITVYSSLNSNVSKTVTLQSSVPPPFVQVFIDNADGAMSLDLVQPYAQTTRKVTAAPYGGSSPAIVETANGDLLFGWIGPSGVEYALIDKYGTVLKPTSTLAGLALAATNTYDDVPSFAAASNGRVGALWLRYQYNSTTQQYNYNVFFAVLDAVGNVVVSPTNLTNSTTWGNSWDTGIGYDSPRIAATDDGRFALGWIKHDALHYQVSHNLYYSVRTTNGDEILPPEALTSDTAGIGQHGAYGVSLAAQSGDRVLVAYSYNGDGGWNIWYSVLDSAGATIRSSANLSQDGTGREHNYPDAVQLSDGKTIIAWNTLTSVAFAVLDGAGNLIAGPTTLTHPAAVLGSEYPSVTADAAGHAVITWMDKLNRYNLYYALVDGAGVFTTPPMIYRSSSTYPNTISTSSTGQGNTSFSWLPPAGVDAVVAFENTRIVGTAGSYAPISIRYTNHALTAATNPVLSVTLASNLSYLGDTLGISPTLSGNTIFWRLPDISFMAGGQFVLRAGLPEAASGMTYPITLTIGSDGPEMNEADNTAHAEVMIVQKVYLPVILQSRR